MCDPIEVMEIIESHRIEAELIFTVVFGGFTVALAAVAGWVEGRVGG